MNEKKDWRKKSLNFSYAKITQFILSPAIVKEQQKAARVQTNWGRSIEYY
jgi:hypothetical protein